MVTGVDGRRRVDARPAAFTLTQDSFLITLSRLIDSLGSHQFVDSSPFDPVSSVTS